MVDIEKIVIDIAKENPFLNLNSFDVVLINENELEKIKENGIYWCKNIVVIKQNNDIYVYDIFDEYDKHIAYFNDVENEMNEIIIFIKQNLKQINLIDFIGLDNFILNKTKILGLAKITYGEYKTIQKFAKQNGYKDVYFFIGKNKKELEENVLKVKSMVNINGYDIPFHYTVDFINGLKNIELINEDGIAIISSKMEPILLFFENDNDYIAIAIAPKEL